jgi:hypothetical protein
VKAEPSLIAACWSTPRQTSWRGHRGVALLLGWTKDEIVGNDGQGRAEGFIATPTPSALLLDHHYRLGAVSSGTLLHLTSWCARIHSPAAGWRGTEVFRSRCRQRRGAVGSDYDTG